MAKSTVNIDALQGALDAQRQARNLSWRQLAKEMDVSPSLLSRINNGLRPDADSFATIIGWLRIPAEKFFLEAVPNESTKDEAEPSLMAQLAPLLRAQKDLDADDVRHLEEVFQATVRLVQSRKMAK